MGGGVNQPLGAPSLPLFLLPSISLPSPTLPVPPYSPSLEVGPLPFPPTFPFPSPPLEVGPLKFS